jgi:cell division transport system permease protein
MMSRLRYFARETVVSLRRNLMMTIAGVLTVAVSLALFGGSLLLTRWASNGTQIIKNDVRLEVFMNVNATDEQIKGVRIALARDPEVKYSNYVDHQGALAEFKRLFHKDPDLVANTRAADLPTSFRVAPKKAELTDTVRRRYKVLAGVESVVTPAEALRNILDVTAKVKYILFVLSAVLLVSSLFLIVNTIRLATFARRREIEVMKLVGASNWFVRIPFLAEGLAQGLFGASIATSVVLILKFAGFDNWFNNPNSLFYRFYLTTGDATVVALLVLFFGMAIGLAGSALGLRRFLRT